MIKSTTTSLRFCNSNRTDAINVLIDEYRSVMGQFIQTLWNEPKINRMADASICSQIQTWLSARMVQCAGKQASAIVLGTRAKQSRRKFIIDKLKEEGKLKEADKLQKIYDNTSVSMPVMDDVKLELDSRFIKVDMNNKTSFDGWLTISSIGNGMKIIAPFKKTRHFNKLLSQGNMKAGVRLSSKDVTFMFDLPDVKSSGDKVLGVDIGMKDTLSCSNGQQIGVDKHGHTYQKICGRLARKKKGGKSFQRTQRHRTNFLNWCVNQIIWSGIKTLQRENIKNLRKFKRNRRDMQAWNYAELFQILDGKAKDAGVQIKLLSPVYTSQRCSECGYTRKTNRDGKEFKCMSCGNTMDADLNAAINLSLPLREISYGDRHQFDNRTGFFWRTDGQEPIVPDVK